MDQTKRVMLYFIQKYHPDVLTFKVNPKGDVMNILLAHDGSEHADKALDRAAEVAEKFNAELHVIVVAVQWDTISEALYVDMQQSIEEMIRKDARNTLETALSKLSSKGVKAEGVIEWGRAQDKILEKAESMKADLIVIGSRGHHGISKFFLGSVSSEVAEHAKCDVLVVK